MNVIYYVIIILAAIELSGFHPKKLYLSSHKIISIIVTATLAGATC